MYSTLNKSPKYCVNFLRKLKYNRYLYIVSISDFNFNFNFMALIKITKHCVKFSYNIDIYF